MKNYKYDGTRKLNIKAFDCDDTGEFKERHEAIREFTRNLEAINEYQQKLFAEQKEGIIFIFQAMDAAGKDGAVRAVLSCLSPQGVSEHSFKVPSSEENRHDYLWRFWDALPEKGSIAIFNRSYYEDVLVQKVHKIYEKNKYADRIDRDEIIDKRYEQIRGFEKYLWENSIRVVKIFLNVSKEEQARRFISRIDTPKKNWKFSSGDIDERAYWDDYMEAYETCITRTARKNAPWYVVPADHKWYARLVISRIVLNELKNMDPQWPVLSDEEKQKLAGYREMLVRETDLREEDESGEKLKPSDTAVGIALRDDREALSGKKFEKLLKKSVFENFSERFGVSEETKKSLGEIYLNYEAMEADAEADDMAAVRQLYKTNKEQLGSELEGCGKEARKLFGHFKKASKGQIEVFCRSISLAYTKFEDAVKQYMTAYEINMSLEGADADAELAAYADSLRTAYEEHRAAVAADRTETEAELARLASEYAGMGQAFRAAAEDTADVEDAADAADTAADTASDEAPAADDAPDAEAADIVAADAAE